MSTPESMVAKHKPGLPGETLWNIKGGKTTDIVQNNVQIVQHKKGFTLLRKYRKGSRLPEWWKEAI